ncbi:class I SAM-dependent methyltransferase [Maliponia aquimaris]|uniref:Methyltransferase domain protein n=1 Tax=Maliponia aquimaris TaxID=1673631 RepID=A0A238K199_9RHOB|nr:class I SAM-dependent methyltransferase [Maliponia aquimaris]SMX36655.1 Methyltransferase domain protein [Maliponia aquimaris]
MTDRQDHWQAAYAGGEAGVSWFEAEPEVSLAMIVRAGLAPGRAIDVGGGASRLAGHLRGLGWDVTVLDISQAALEIAQARLGEGAAQIAWVAADITRWRAALPFDLWHDRAVFHFLTAPEDRVAYAAALRTGLRIGGAAVIATFAEDGPERCSGLPVVRYAPEALAAELGQGLRLEAAQRHVHVTPSGREQAFQISLLRRVDDK